MTTINPRSNRTANTISWLMPDILLSTCLNSYSSFSISKYVRTSSFNNGRKASGSSRNLSYCRVPSKSWTKTLLMYDKDDRRNWSGNNTCGLLMSSVKEEAMKRNITPAALDLGVYKKDISTALKTEMPSNDNSGKSIFFSPLPLSKNNFLP